ncbi:MAG: tRNA uridine-5-carboxymethylaminomethyl(34) synthesis GTPase MnmE [Spirochaetes bacterium]|nr:tRNA uridine-5-carboxymethylaminomethyl(34) synthesis GTPase MnmE [Spirochaetota bacterium]
MERGYLSSGDVIVACATPPGAGALALVRLSGPGSLDLLAGRFSRPLAIRDAPGHSVVYGRILDASGSTADEVTVSVFRSPRSYTGEDSADIVCHGSAVVVDAVLSACESAGARKALPGEFSFRAFANGKMDLARAEAVAELARARSSEARADALSRLAGSLSRDISSIRSAMLEVLAAVEVRLDYGEDEVDGDLSAEEGKLTSLRGRLDGLASSWRVGRLVDQGAVVAVAGRTNAGKSSLFNRLLREERSIVSDVHGTTRDYIEAVVDLGGVPVRLFDTAGLRESADPVEAEGVRRSRLVLEGADVVLYLADGTAGLAPGEDPSAEPALAGKTVIRVWTKVDLPDAKDAPAGWLPFSSLTGEGIGTLCDAILDGFGILGETGGHGTRIASERHRRLIESSGCSLGEAMEALSSGLPLDAVALDLREALDALGELLGEGLGDGILETIFSGFCVGK